MNYMEQMLYGELELMSDIKDSPALKRNQSNRKDLQDKLQESLTDENLKLFCQLIEHTEEVLSLTCRDYFFAGWRFGTKLMLELLS